MPYRTILIGAAIAFGASFTRALRRKYTPLQALTRSLVVFFIGGAGCSLLMHFWPGLPIEVVGGVAALIGATSDTVLAGLDAVTKTAFTAAARRLDDMDDDAINTKDV